MDMWCFLILLKWKEIHPVKGRAVDDGWKEVPKNEILKIPSSDMIIYDLISTVTLWIFFVFVVKLSF